MPSCLVHDIGDPGGRLGGGMGVALAEAGIDLVTRLGDGGDQRVVDPAAQIAVVRRTGLVAGHGNGQAVEVQGHVAVAMAAVGRPQAVPGQAQHRLVQHRAVRLRRQVAEQSGQRGLGG